ncbi:hypothetical protein GALL_71460 [mine drainage metagenome]|uniref:Uncharacterized protein n=1 Tax=mine drainage metagenome TaxID=410659 RepID=A0A1J5SRA1_9ZZZZ
MIKGMDINLGGTVYTVPPLSLGAIEDMHDRLLSFKGGADPESCKLVIDCTWRALKRNYPDIERDFVRENVGFENMGEVMSAVMNVSMLRQKGDDAAGKAMAESSTGTGSTST